ncbi:MAG: class I SAM-dependent methyltransferase [Anaerolineae bacterium]|nr:class I SAM-dependent methyltransferase [Anaerolineae bacterium]MDW8099029.1 class I SAM-dependent methyltransferase [Anaerolineae bacterium]
MTQELSAIGHHLLDTRRAFDSVAADYDGPLGNNALVQRMRAAMWRTLTAVFSPGARLLDLGCGTGIDAAYLAARGYEILAVDWAPQMVERTRRRAAEMGLSHQIRASVLGIHELGRLRGERFDGIYSNLGPLNCVPDLHPVARDCARLLRPGGRLVVSVIGRLCPWELAYYLLRGDLQRASVRYARAAVPVSLNRQTVWTRYYTPREFYRAFADEFELIGYRALGLFLPPPYLIGVVERWPRLGAVLGWLDDRLGAWPLLREAGDHFLMVLARHDVQRAD